MNLPEPTRNANSSDPEKAWVVRYEAPPAADGRRRQPRVYGRTKKACTENLIEVLGQVQAGTYATDRRMKFGDYLTRRLRWWESEGGLKSIDSYREAVELYLRPAFGTCA